MIVCNVADAAALLVQADAPQHGRPCSSPRSLVVVGMWVERFVIVVTSLEHDFLPSSWQVYSPTWVDLGILSGTLGFFLFLFLLFLRFVPFVPIHETKKIAWEERRGKVIPRALAGEPLPGAGCAGRGRRERPRRAPRPACHPLAGAAARRRSDVDRRGGGVRDGGGVDRRGRRAPRQGLPPPRRLHPLPARGARRDPRAAAHPGAGRDPRLRPPRRPGRLRRAVVLQHDGTTRSMSAAGRSTRC